MGEDVAQYPIALGQVQPPPRSVVDDEAVALAVDRGPDPLECGFVLAGGVLAPLPAKVRLPHEDDEHDDDEQDDEEPVRG